jgi:hypothetical protein
MHMGPFTHVDVIRRFNHADVRQSPEPPPEDPNKSGNIDIFLLVRCTTSTVTQREQEDALIRLWFIWPEVKMIGKFLRDNFPPANPSFGTESIQAAGSRVEQLKVIGTLKKG